MRISLQLMFADSKGGTKHRWSAWKPPKPWLIVAVYSLCSEKLLASFSSSHTCQRAGTADPCVSAQTWDTKLCR